MTDKLEIRQGNAPEQERTTLQHTPDWNELIRTAIEKGPEAVDALERIEGMMIRSNERSALVAFENSRIAVLGQLGPIERDKLVVVNDGFKFWQSSLEAQEAAIKAAGAVDFGFSWYWDTEMVGDTPMSVCILNHRDGHSRRSRFPIQRDKRDNRALSEMQKEHASTSQADRITFMRVWGIVSLTEKEEGDGRPNVATVTPDQALKIEAALREYVERGGGDEKAVHEAFASWKNWAGAKTFSDWPAAKYQATIQRIAQRTKELEAAQ